MAALKDLIATLEKAVVLPGAFGERPHVVIGYEELKQVIDALKKVEQRKRVPRETHRQEAAI